MTMIRQGCDGQKPACTYELVEFPRGKLAHVHVTWVHPKVRESHEAGRVVDHPTACRQPQEPVVVADTSRPMCRACLDSIEALDNLLYNARWCVAWAMVEPLVEARMKEVPW